jgi:hypothetical protein
MPFFEPVPAGTATIVDFIQALRVFEGKFPGEETNLPLMVTRIRKIFYGLPSWDEILIPKAASITKPYEIREVETSRKVLYQGSSGIWAPSKRYDIKDGSVWHQVSGGSCTCGRPEVYHLQEIEQGGHWLDIGHVFAGLDALYNPDRVWTWKSWVARVILESNAEAVTWIGDLGSILGEWRFAEDEFMGSRPGSPRRSLSNADRQAILTQMAPARDMLGNVDAFILYDNYFRPATISPPATRPRASDLLEKYYLNSNPYIGKRFTLFTKRMNLVYSPAISAFTGEAAWHNTYETQTSNSYAMYYGANTESGFPDAEIERQGIAFGMSFEKAISRSLNRVMIEELRKLVAAE